MSPNWYDLGVQLLNTEQAKKLKAIQANNPGNVEKCCTELFDYWLQVDTNANWDKLITALQQIDYVVLADRIRAMTLEGVYDVMVILNDDIVYYAIVILQYKYSVLVITQVQGEVKDMDRQ